MKCTRRSSAVAPKAPPPKRGTRHQPKSGVEDPEDLGVTEGQLDKIADKVGQRLAKSGAAEVVSAIASQAAPNNGGPLASGANTPPPPKALVNLEREVAVHVLIYSESEPKTLTSASTSSTPLAYHVGEKLQEKIKMGICRF